MNSFSVLYTMSRRSYHSGSIYWLLADKIPAIDVISSASSVAKTTQSLTFHISNTLLQDLLQNLGVLELLLNLAYDRLSELGLLAPLNLPLVAHPRVKNLLGLSSKGSALLELVSLSLKLSGFLNVVSN